MTAIPTASVRPTSDLVNTWPGRYLIFLLIALFASLRQDAAAFTNFITRNVDKLYDGSAEFRFVSWNAGPFITASYAWDPFEQEDFFRSVQQLGGTVVRLMPPFHVCSFVPSDDALITGYANGSVQYNETAWRNFDKAMQLAAQYGIRVIVPTHFNNNDAGDPDTWAGYVGKTRTDFFNNDATALSAYKQFLNWWANRTNFYTGTLYKNDKTILCWETGNEMVSSTGPWVSNIATYLKSIDPNHLVMDGRKGVNADGLTFPSVDIVSMHYYYLNPVLQLQADANTAKGKKAFICGEFGFLNTSTGQNFVQTAIDSGMSGVLMWELQSHSKNGGFVEWSCDTGDFAFQGYRWPGFASGSRFDETNVLSYMRSKAYEIRGLTAPAVPIPATPTNVRIFTADVPELSWRGSTGASGYDIQRATASAGPWTTVAANVSDAVAPSKSKWRERSNPVYNDGPPLFSDLTAKLNVTYYYRVIAKNSSGSSAASSVVSVVAKRVAIIDELVDFSRLQSFSANLELRSNQLRYRRDDRDRAASSDGTTAYMIYKTPQDMTRFVFEALTPNVTISTSIDGVTYAPITCNTIVYNSEPYYIHDGSTIPYKVYPATTQIPAGTRYVKLQINDGATEILRAEVEYLAGDGASNFETEYLAVAGTSGDTHRVFDWSGFENGIGTILDADAVNDYVTYLVPNLPAGTYTVKVGVKKAGARGQWQLGVKAASGSTFTNVGGMQDEFSVAEAFSEFNLGTWIPGTTSDKHFRFMVVGKNSSSSAYGIAFDYIKLIPQ